MRSSGRHAAVGLAIVAGLVGASAPAAAPPPNDEAANATVIGALPYMDTSNNSEATPDDPDDPNGCGKLNSVWYSFTPVHDMRLTPTVTGSGGYLPQVTPFRGPVGALVPIGDLLGGCPLDPFEAKAGTTYHFMIGVNYTTLGGGFTLSVTGVPRARVELSVSRKIVDYGGRVTVTAHLVDMADTSNDVVSIFKTPARGPKTLVRSQAVNASGNLVATVRPSKNTTFVAEWAGESGWLPGKSVVRSVGVRVITTTRLAGYYGRSGVYKLYRSGDAPIQIGTVRPKRAYHHLQFAAQKRRPNGAWRKIAGRSFLIRANGSVAAVLANLGPGAYRVKNSYVGDSDYLGDGSPWQYLRVT